MQEISDNPIIGNYDFEHFCEFNKRIFEDIYEWAGEPRTMPIVKAEAVLPGMSVIYSQPKNIRKDTENVLNAMQKTDWKNLSENEQITQFSERMTELWKVHPFREGNTRTTITFMCQFAEEHGITIDRTVFAENAEYTRDALALNSAIGSGYDYREPEHLNKIVQISLERGKELELKPELVKSGG